MRLGLQVPLKIHALMEDTHNDNAALVPSEEHDMAAGGIFEIAAPDMIARPPSAGLGRCDLHGIVQKPDVTVRLLDTPAVGSVGPDGLKIGSCARRESVAAHRGLG